MASIRKLIFAVFLLLAGIASSNANTCAPASSAGAAASDWATFCWFDFTGYNDATVRSAAGQNFSFSLNDGSVLTLTLKATSSTTTALSAVAAPSWSGAAIGNSAYIGIPGSPVLYTSNNGSTVTLTLSNIQVTPPGGVVATSGYAIVATDAESSNGGESLVFTTNGGNWVQWQAIPPIAGNTYPTVVNGGGTVTETGVGGTVGSYIFGSNNSPTTITARMVASGLQGVMFAVRYAWVSVNKSINGTRLNSADQFKYAVTATSNGTQLVANTSTGSGSGPFTAAMVTASAGYPLTISESMATGSISTLANYTSTLSCTNATAGSPTVMPSAVATTSFNLGTLAYGDAVSCMFTNMPKRPTLGVLKSSVVLSDPVNNAVNPKRIPGGVVRYDIVVSNTGTGTVDLDSLVITDAIPANTKVCVATACANPIVEFIDGATPSGLSFNYASNVTYSNTADGRPPFTYTPVPDVSGFDAAVTGLQIKPTGTMNGSASGNPGFTVRFRIKIN